MQKIIKNYFNPIKEGKKVGFKCMLIILLVATFNIGTAYSQSQNVSLDFDNTPITEVFKSIEAKTSYRFFYQREQLDVNRKVSLHVKNKSVQEVLNSLFAGSNVNFTIQKDNLILLKTTQISQGTKEESRKVTGIVTDDEGIALPGVSVSVKKTTGGATTDINGKYEVTVSSSESVLVFSYVGMTTQEITVGNNKTLNIKLLNNAIGLKEVVVSVGYGSVNKKDVTGSVGTISNKEFNKGTVVNPVDLIQGRMPGINVVNNGGEPGAGASVRIRGSNSVRSGQDPLYVVDGVPLDITDVQPSGATVTGTGSAATKNPLNFLNPDDIESMDVLKDASATAIYGSRGANGVILITTKKGKSGKGVLTYSANTSIAELPKQLDLLNAQEFLSFRADRGLTGADYGSNTNWQNQIYRTARTQSHNLSYGGGNDKGSYRASLSYLDQEGIIKKTGLEKYTGRFNVIQNLINDKLRLEANLTAARTNDQRVPIGETGGFEGDVILSSLKLNPTLPVYNPDGTFKQMSADVRNPLAMIDLTSDNNQTDRVMGNISGSFEIIKGLKYKINLAADQSKASRKVMQNQSLIYLTNKGTVDISDVSLSSNLIENYLTYDFNINEKHRFNVLGGHSYQQFKVYTYRFSEDGFTITDFDYINNLALGNFKAATVGSSITKNALQSFFGRVNYNLDNKYLVTATLRSDGSTKFGANNKYGLFPSASFAWKLNEEEFVKNLGVFSNLKMRLGWGITGNQEIPNKISQILLGSSSSGNNAILDGSAKNVTSGITLSRTPNPDIRWETTNQVNAGLDFGFLNGRITGTIDYFDKTTSDVLLQVNSIAPAPTTTVWSNVPGMKILNRGFELGLTGVIVNNKGLTWDAGVNFTTIKNEVSGLPMSQITTGAPSGPGITGFSSQVVKNGYPIGTFWGRKFLGFDELGNSTFEKDANGVEIQQSLGSAMPKLTYGFNTSVSYKGVDLAVNLNGVYGNKIYNNVANIMSQNTLISKEWNATKDAAQSKENPNGTLTYSSRFIEDGSFLRLSNATLGYSVNVKSINWLSKLRFSVTGNNLFVITDYSGYDPEVNADHSASGVPSMGIDWTTYPKARTVVFGVNVEF
ncbi:SusC/RagA family TonB-linked outer membrane protein [Solitalea longa]|uniref:SusC/RagA family TonB-linked outer membrane protein n=1 Tax=Solitalea longa TaxID=2079460 RepID=A0A2S4ZZ17_9SPHI|nr:TonB-dependent receptor [Solitalea longa]POY35103.1 SusC/RagA family TonB-linked outer membrane protein [Solitalea longa]